MEIQKALEIANERLVPTLPMNPSQYTLKDIEERVYNLLDRYFNSSHDISELYSKNEWEDFVESIKELTREKKSSYRYMFGAFMNFLVGIYIKYYLENISDYLMCRKIYNQIKNFDKTNSYLDDFGYSLNYFCSKAVFPCVGKRIIKKSNNYAQAVFTYKSEDIANKFIENEKNKYNKLYKSAQAILKPCVEKVDSIIWTCEPQDRSSLRFEDNRTIRYVHNEINKVIVKDKFNEKTLSDLKKEFNLSHIQLLNEEESNLLFIIKYNFFVEIDLSFTNEDIEAGKKISKLRYKYGVFQKYDHISIDTEETKDVKETYNCEISSSLRSTLKYNTPKASITKRALAGAVIAGTPGAIIGAASAIEKNSRVSTVDVLQNPDVTIRYKRYDIVMGLECGFLDEFYSGGYASACGSIEIIENKNGKKNSCDTFLNAVESAHRQIEKGEQFVELSEQHSELSDKISELNSRIENIRRHFTAKREQDEINSIIDSLKAERMSLKFYQFYRKKELENTISAKEAESVALAPMVKEQEKEENKKTASLIHDLSELKSQLYDLDKKIESL